MPKTAGFDAKLNRLGIRPKPTSTWKDWHGFAIDLKPDTDLGHAILVIEFSTGAYMPVAVASTINEAREMAFAHAANLPDGLAITSNYKLWARGVDGKYLTVPVVIS